MAVGRFVCTGQHSSKLEVLLEKIIVLFFGMVLIVSQLLEIYALLCKRKLRTNRKKEIAS